MDAQAFVDQITIATPCPARWDTMRGDDRVRFCDGCRKNVYNLPMMSAVEVLDLVREKEGSLCARLFRRGDGTVVTKDCRAAIAPGRFQYSLRRLMAVVTGFAALFGLASQVVKFIERQREVLFVEMGDMVVPLAPPEPWVVGTSPLTPPSATEANGLQE